MEDKARIQQMLKEGKINSGQAVLLLEALKESGTKKERIFKQVLNKRKEREKKMWKFLGGWIAAVSIFAICFIAILSGQQGRDTNKALKYFNEASIYLTEKDYARAISVIKQGIRKAEGLPLGYALLGSAYRHLYEENRDDHVKQKEMEAFQKADSLKVNLKRRAGMNNVAVVFSFIFLIFVAGVISIIFLLIYNHLVRNEEKVDQAMAQIRTMYQRKLDLIPALLEAVKIYLQHERETLENVTRARTNAIQLEDAVNPGHLVGEVNKLMESQKEVSGSLGRLLALVEKYPDLKANEHFLTIQGQIEETENLITRERGIYNKRVRGLNSSTRYFPANIVAGLFHFQSREYFELTNEAV